MEHENVHHIALEGREIILIGTAHVSRESADLVERVIEEERPDTVCVELCRPRYEAIRQRDKWQETDIVKVIREKRTSILLSQLMMASLQRKIAQKFNIIPGEEMLRAIDRAEAVGAEIVLADREIRVTLLRTWRKMGFWSKVKFLPDVLLSLFATDEITEEEIEKLKQHDVLELALQTVGEKLPGLKTTLIDERDLYLAHTIGHAPGARIVAVVGAGHVPGVVPNETAAERRPVGDQRHEENQRAICPRRPRQKIRPRRGRNGRGQFASVRGHGEFLRGSAEPPRLFSPAGRQTLNRNSATSPSLNT